jgi:membrane-associated phospholipid phosphatase
MPTTTPTVATISIPIAKPKPTAPIKLILVSSFCICSIIICSVLSFTIAPINWPISNPEVYVKPWIHPETVPFNVLLAALVAAPSLLLASLAVAYGWCLRKRRITNEWWRPLLEVSNCLLVAFSGTLAVAEAFKLTVGRPRPYYMTTNDSPLFTKERLKEGRKSFPSGHTSNGFCGAFCLFLLLGASLGAFKRNGLNWKLRIPLLILLSIPIAFAAWVALTRVLNNRHWPSDVVGGAVIGVFWAFAAFLWHFDCQNGPCPLQGLVKENAQA